ncbi:DUF596 domain-containing protein [Pasteurella canis]|uniref:Uncharacterized protein conserved in bacteria n=2 Tax=Pasteurella canis TaxID=753 RepID=A0A379EWN2_9PAST|nr:DUF596 domain-containing protein [Pasteurella canis]SUC10795.1 Uncharacterized protein conserved in bacteria [Pasteurella canis]
MNPNMKKKILEKSKGLPLFALLAEFEDYFGSVKDSDETKELFLSFIAELMHDGELKFAIQGKFLEGSIEEQIDVFRQAWPDHYDENEMEYDIDNTWWITYAPAGAVWICEDGYEEWT